MEQCGKSAINERLSILRGAFPHSYRERLRSAVAAISRHALIYGNEPCNETRVAHNPTIPSPICR